MTFPDIFALLSGHQRGKNKEISGLSKKWSYQDTEAKISGHISNLAKNIFPDLTSRIH